MLINAKFTSTCPVCGRPIHVGERVSWERGHKAVHAQCGSQEAVGPSLHSEPVICWPHLPPLTVAEVLRGSTIYEEPQS